MPETLRLPEFEFKISGQARFMLDRSRSTLTLITRVSTQPWIPLLTVKSRTRLPQTLAAELSANPHLIQRLQTLLACALAPHSRQPYLNAVPLPLLDAMPEQLLHAAGMALPMMVTAVCNYLGLPQVDLNEEIDRHTATLRRALKDNLGVTSPGHPEETRDEFVERIKRALHRMLPTLNGRSPRQNELANELDWDPSYIRSRQRKHGIKNHDELLRLIGMRKRPRPRMIKSAGK